MTWLKEFPKAEAAALAALLAMFIALFHQIHVVNELVGSSSDVTKIDAFGRLMGGMRESILWALGLSFGYVGVKRLTSKPSVIKAEAEAEAMRSQADQ